MTEDVHYWFVTVTLAGEPVEPLLVRSALQRLTERHPFMTSIRFNASGAQLLYWDEGPDLASVTRLALHLWEEHREAAGLPDWDVVGLDIVEQGVRTEGGLPQLTASQELRPLGPLGI